MSFEQERSYGNAPRAVDTTSGADLRGPLTGGSGNNEEMMRRLDAAMNSPYAIEKLLNRLKQSIYSAREFSAFLKERSVLEDRYAQGYKKLVRHASDVIRRTDARQGSYGRSFAESLIINERLADNGLQMASTLQAMSDELRDIAEKSERGRKHWKHSTIDAEKALTEADTARQRAQDKYKNAADQYERARAGERTGKFGIKKGSQADQEQAFKEKVDSLDAEYAARATAARDGRREYESTTRPNIARALQDVIAECDAVLSMQLTKLASLTEKHIVGSGMAVAPIRTGDVSGPELRGLRHAAQDIDNHKDFLDFMTDGVEPTPLKGRSRRNTDVDLVHTPVQPLDNYGSRPSMEYNNRSSYQTPLGTQHDSKAPQLPDIGHDSFSNSFEMQRPGAQNRSSYFGGQPEPISKTPTNPLQQTGVIQDTNATSLGASRGPTTGSALPAFNRESSTTSALPAFDRASPPQHSAGFGPPPRAGTTSATGFGQTSGAYSSDINKPDSFGRGAPLPGQNFASNDFNAPSGPPPRSNTMGMGNLGPTGSQRPDGLPPNQFMPPSGPNTMGTQGFNRDASPPRQDPYNNNFANSTGAPRAGTLATTALNQPSGHTTRQDTMGPSSYNQSPGAPLKQDTTGLGAYNQPTNQPSRQDTMGANTYNQPSGPPPRQDTMGPNTYNQSTVQQPHKQDNLLPTNRNQSGPLNTGSYSGPGQPAPGSYLDPGRNAGPHGNAPAGVAGALGAAGATSAANRAQQNTQQRNLPSQGPPRPALPPNNPVFGIHLDELFRRDQSAVPAIVFQCIQAIDTFGMHTEGIYRVPGSTPIVNQLKNQFDHDSTKVKFNTPASFSNDINSVATLLKIFLRDLPDPLMTRTAYNGFIGAAREEDNIMRRDGLHQQINGLPDANYATLRVLVLHLHRVAMNHDSNKMTLQNLSTVFGPTVMGGADNVSDAGLQTKVMETILQHTHDIFDPDE